MIRRISKMHRRRRLLLFFSSVCLLFALPVAAQEKGESEKGPPPVPVRTASVTEKTVSEQISLIGTTEAIRTSTVAAEVSGIVEHFPVKAGDYVEKGVLLAKLRDTETRLRLKGAVAGREKVKADLQNAEKELQRLSSLKETQSVALSAYDKARFAHSALEHAYLQSQAEIDRLEYELERKEVHAPFSGYVSQEHVQVGEWLMPGGPVATLMDLSRVIVTVDVPERYAVKIDRGGAMQANIPSLSNEPMTGAVYAVLPQGSASARTIPVQIQLENTDGKIVSGMESVVRLPLTGKRTVLLVPKDAVVTAGGNRLVYVVNDGKATPVPVEVTGYYEGFVSVAAGGLQIGADVVIRGNERLRPGQAVAVQSRAGS